MSESRKPSDLDVSGSIPREILDFSSVKTLLVFSTPFSYFFWGATSLDRKLCFLCLVPSLCEFMLHGLFAFSSPIVNLRHPCSQGAGQLGATEAMVLAQPRGFTTLRCMSGVRIVQGPNSGLGKRGPE